MLKHLRNLLFAIIAMVVSMVGLTIVPASADTNVTVTSSATSTGSADTSNTVVATPNGATQLLWWYPNHHIKVSMKSVKKAPHLKVKYANCATQSKSIAKQAHGATIVVAKAGSTICNTGKQGGINGGFVWHVKHMAVLKWNKNIHLYQHVFNLIHGKLVKTCGNHMGGHIDKMYTNVVQVRYAADLVYQTLVSALAEAYAKAVASGTCPDGTQVNTEASASASASVAELVSYQLKFQGNVLSSKKASLLASVKSSAEAQASAKAEAKISIQCGSTPPPATQSPTVQIGQKNDVDVSNTATVCADYDVPGSDSATLKFTSDYGSYQGGNTFAVSGQGTKCTTYMAPSEVPQSGHDTLTASLRDNTTGLSATPSSTNITINPAPKPPM